MNFFQLRGCVPLVAIHSQKMHWKSFELRNAENVFKRVTLLGSKRNKQGVLIRTEHFGESADVPIKAIRVFVSKLGDGLVGCSKYLGVHRPFLRIERAFFLHRARARASLTQRSQKRKSSGRQRMMLKYALRSGPRPLQQRAGL